MLKSRPLSTKSPKQGIRAPRKTIKKGVVLKSWPSSLPSCKKSKQVNLCWIQHFQHFQHSWKCWIQHFQHSYIFGPLKCWKCWIQHKKMFSPFFAYFERSSCPNYCTNRFVIKNCISDWKMEKIKRYVFWVFFKKPKTLCKIVLKMLKMLNSTLKMLKMLNSTFSRFPSCLGGSS